MLRIGADSGMRASGKLRKTAHVRPGKRDSVSAQGAKKEHADEAFHERVYWHSLAIVNLAAVKIDSQVAHADGFETAHTEWFGTGAAVRWNGQELIVTAGHVIDGASSTQIALMPRAALKIVWN